MALIETIQTLLTVVGVPLVRNLFGWFSNAYEDGKLSEYEWKQLAITTGRTMLVGLGVFYGINWSGIGIEVELFSSMVFGMLFEIIWTSLSKNNA